MSLGSFGGRVEVNGNMQVECCRYGRWWQGIGILGVRVDMWVEVFGM